MATITTVQSGDWLDETATGPWPSPYTKPTNADDVIIGSTGVSVSAINLSTNVVTAAGHGLVDGDYFTVSATALPGSVSADFLYRAVGVSGNDFQLSRPSLYPTVLDIATTAGSGVKIHKAGTGHVVTMNGACVAKTLTVRNFGELKPSQVTNSTLTVEGVIDFYAGAYFNADLSAVDTTCTVRTNNSAVTSAPLTFRANSQFTLKGKPRLRHTRLNGAMLAAVTSCTVDAATGWKQGDEIVIAPSTTTYGSGNGWTPHFDTVTLNGSYSNGSTSLSWTGNTTYAHADNVVVANLSSNLTFTAGGYRGNIQMLSLPQYGAAYGVHEIDNVRFYDILAVSGGSNTSVELYAPSSIGDIYTVKNSVFYKASLGSYSPTAGRFLREWNVYHTPAGNATGWSAANVLDICDGESDSVFLGSALNCGVVRGAIFSRITLCGVSGSSTGAAMSGGGDFTCKYYDFEFSCNQFDHTPNYAQWPDAQFFNPIYGAQCASYRTFYANYAGKLKLYNPTFVNTNVLFYTPPTGAWSDYRFLGTAGNSDTQEIYTVESATAPTYYRDATTKKTADASFVVNGTLYGTDRTFPIEVLIPANTTAKVIGQCKVDANFYNSGTWYAPSVSAYFGTTLADSYTATSAVSSDWEEFTLDIANALSTPQLCTIKLKAERRGSSGKCWFSGIPLYPFVNAVRHYGYLFDETSVLRTADPLKSATFATADAYTGMSITWGASSSTAITTSNTFQKLFDYHQAKATQNVTSALALTGVGVAGSPALFAAGNVTISDGAVLNGAGSISMGAYTLSTEFASGVNYTYTGGAWSQLTTVPTFNGGTLNLGAAATYTFTMAASTLVVVTPTSPSTYDLSGCTLTGTLTVNNAAAHAITVQVPAGATTSDSGNTGGAITFSAPAVERGLEFTGLLAGSFVRVVKNSDQSELFVDTNSATSETWDDATSGSLVVDYVIMKNGYDQIHVTGVTVTGAVGTGIQTVTVSQTPARWYQTSSGLTINTNAFANATTKLFGLTTGSTLQNFASYLMEQWITLGGTGGAFANKPFPLTANGPNSFSWIDGWEADLTTYPNTITNMSRDGMRYLDASGNVTAVWCAILTSGVPSGKQVRFQQSDGGTAVDADNTGDMDQLVQIYGDATHGNFDKRGYLVLKVQAEGYDQAESNVVTLYGTLEDQLYVVGLTPAANGIATGNPTVTLTLDRGTYNDVTSGKTFGVRIVSADSGEDIMRELRYNFGAGGEYPAASGYDGFDWHDLVQTNGADFKTVRGNLYGTAASKGVVVYSSGTTLHPDFTLFTADDGTTYSPPLVADVSITGMPTAAAATTRLQIINQTALSAAAWSSGATYSAGDIVKRVAGFGSEQTAGLYMRCTTGGTSGGVEPTWDTTVGNTTNDNGVIWLTCSILFYHADPVNATIALTYVDGEEFLAGETAEIRFAEMDQAATFKIFDTTTIAASTGFSIAVSAEAIPEYATYGIDGSTQDSTFSPNFVSDYIVMDANIDFAGKGAFAYYCYTLTTDAGMWDFWGGVTALDAGNLRINASILNLFFDETAGFVKQTDDVRIFRDDGLRPALDPTTGGHGIEINWRTPVNTIAVGSAVTSQDKTDIIDGVWSRVLPL